MKRGVRLCLGFLLLGPPVWIQCGRQAAPPGAPAPPANNQSVSHIPGGDTERAVERAQEGWRWHAVGGVLVIEGELEEPERLTLKGTTLDEACRAPLGPVRWELIRPPKGEVAELRGEDGRLLAKWDFDAPPPPAVVQVPAPAVPAGSPSTSAPAPAQVRAQPGVTIHPVPVQVQAQPEVVIRPVPLPVGPWVRIKPHLPPVKAQRVQAKPKAATHPAPAQVQAQPEVVIRPVPLPVGPWVRIEPHLPLAKTQRVQAKPEAAIHPAPAQVQAQPKVVIHPVPAQVQARPEVVIHPMPLPVGPWVRIEPHLPLAQAKRVQAKPGATILPAPAQVQAQPKVAIHPVPVQVQARPEVAIHPVPAQVQARPEVATHPAPAQVQAQPEVVIRTVPLTAGPWTQIEPHLPLPRAHRNQSVSRIPAGEPPARVQAPPKVAALPPPAPVPPPGLGARASLQPSLGPIPPPRPAAPILPPPRPAPVQPQPPAPPAAAVPQPGPTPSEPAQPGEASRDWPGAGEALNLLRGPKGRRWICVTFDGGSTAEVAEDVLNVLKEHGIRTTLFLTGDFIRKYPDLVRRMARDGHELGNHTMNHPHFAPHMKRDPQWTRERFQKELLDADRAFYQLLGRPMDPYWRAPYGEQTAELRRWAEELGYRHVGWSEGADSLDWATVKEFNLYRSGSAIIERLEKRLRKDDGDGLIVLMHLGSLRPALDRPAKYLGPFMDWALQDGWHFVAIGDYLKAMGRPAWEPSRRVARINQGAGPDSP